MNASRFRPGSGLALVLPGLVCWLAVGAGPESVPRPAPPPPAARGGSLGSAAFPARLEANLREVQRHFPTNLSTYTELLRVGDLQGAEDAARIGREILGWEGVPEAARRRAEGVVRRVEANGKPYALGSLRGTAADPTLHRGRVVVLDFWASWCRPCVEAVPELRRIHAGLVGTNVVVLSVGLDTDTGVARAFAKKHGITWPQVCDGRGWESPVVIEHGITAIPGVWVLDAAGRVVVAGAQTNLTDSVKRALE